MAEMSFDRQFASPGVARLAATEPAMGNKAKMTRAFERFKGRSFIIGREGHVLIDHDTVSKEHAEIRLVDGRIHLRDLGSTNGTYLVSGNRLQRFREGYIMPNQTLVIGTQQKSVQSLLDTILSLTH